MTAVGGDTVGSDSVRDGAPRTRVRWLIIGFLFAVTTINYADRATFSMAGQGASEDLGLGPVAMGYILSAFAWSYVIAQVPGGLLLDRFGTRRVYVWALVLWSVFTAVQGFAGVFTGLTAAIYLFAMRFMVGLCEGPSFPGNSRIVANWFPGSERGTASAIFNSAQYFSLVAFAPLMGWLVTTFDWPSVFIVMGVLGILAAIVFHRFVKPPTEHPMINRAEFDYIREGGALVELEDRAATTTQPFSWTNLKQVLTSRMLLGVYLGQYCIVTVTYFFSTWFPIYLVRERGMTILEAGFSAAAPALAGFIGGIAGGIISDRILKQTGSVTWARKTPIFIGMILATAIIACVYIEEEWLVLTVMALAFFGKGIASLGWAVVSDTSPKELSGLAGGVFNTFGNTAGIVTPIAVGYIVAATGSFDFALIYVGVHCVVTILAYLLIVPEIRRLELRPV